MAGGEGAVEEALAAQLLRRVDRDLETVAVRGGMDVLGANAQGHRVAGTAAVGLDRGPDGRQVLDREGEAVPPVEQSSPAAAP